MADTHVGAKLQVFSSISAPVAKIHNVLGTQYTTQPRQKGISFNATIDT